MVPLPRDVFDHDALTHVLRHFLRDDTRGLVHRAARRKQDSHADRFGRLSVAAPWGCFEWFELSFFSKANVHSLRGAIANSVACILSCAHSPGATGMP